MKSRKLFPFENLARKDQTPYYWSLYAEEAAVVFEMFAS